MKHGYNCQFCKTKSLAQDWLHNTCPKCQKVYDQTSLSNEGSRKLIYFVNGAGKEVDLVGRELDE